MFFRLKSEIFWVLKEKGIEIFFSNNNLNKVIYADNILEFWSFLEFLVEPKTINEIDKYNLENNKKKSILSFLETKKYGVWEKEKKIDESRFEYFVNAFPNINYNDFSKKFDNVNILIIGLGTAGSYLIEILHKMGLKKFTVIDGDKVENKNIDAQNYKLNEIGIYKGEALCNRYKENCNIHYINKFVYSYDNILEITNNKKYDYIINCADHINLTQSLLKAKSNNKMNSILIESGYSILIQQTIKIDNKYISNKLLNGIKKLKINSKNWIIKNNGCIFNSWMSAFSVAKIIYDDILNIDDTVIAEFDFLQNRYFIGNKFQKEYYKIFTQYISNNMKYKISNNNNKIIDKNNLFKGFEYPNSITYDMYIKNFLLKKYNIEEYIHYEEILSKLKNIKSKNVDINFEENIMDILYEYIEDNYKIEIENIKNIINNNLFEKKLYNTNLNKYTQKINGNLFIYNTDYSDEYNKIINRIHEIFHCVFWEITDNAYEHEFFVMNNEIKFYTKLLQYEKYYDYIEKYIYLTLKKHIKNYLVLNYEKSRLANDFSNFMIEYNNIIKDNITDLIKILNCNVKETPFYVLKYFRAFENNKESFNCLINFILNRKDVQND